ncbi:type I secretion system permease/ATPase [Aromatoleum anaerobium]|uniref:Type I secretion system permease/ATPase n=1 Tax=Aromatoleum anaerobium TaxID=182180 RepID=A0ABX1PKR9_9RHOO|nr:type I secretion system permease/ATPase [Aromatoleum anaerobium]MCK0505570.1 type I secretion system permease/ATPase [Aromatoleum anaerobium]
MIKSLATLLRSPALAGLDRRSLVTVAVASIAINLLIFALPLYSLQVYDRVLTSRSLDTLWLLTLIVAVALSLSALIDTLRARMLLRVGNAYALALGPRLMDASIAHSARLAEPSAQALRDLHTVRSFVTGAQGLVSLIDAPLVPVFLVGVYAMHAGLGSVMLAGMVSLVALALATDGLTGKLLRAAGEAGIDAQRRVEGVMQNAEVVEAMGMRAAMRASWQVAQTESMSLASAAAERAAHLSGLVKAVRLLLNLLLAAAGAWYVIHDEITIGVMVAASILAARGLAPLEAMIGAWKGLVSTRAAIDRINTALEHFPRTESAMSLPVPCGRLSVERLVYAPPGAGQPTIKGVSFNLEPGCWLGLIGPSAAGKSTLAKLICGVWQPVSGSVRLDGADVFAWNRAEFGRHCGYLPQDVELFAGSIRDNIARFGPAEDAEVVAAAQMAGCHHMILRFANGYDTQLGSSGAALSGGQRQRIGLARALFRQPRLIVLDEPNASLDHEGETALLQAVGRARDDGATIVMISHRPSVLARADMLAVLADGQVQQFGPREEVLARLQPAVPARPVAGVRRVGV